MATSGFTRRSSSDIDTQPVAIVSIDTTARKATGLSRVRTEIDIFTDYAVGGIYVTPAIGDQWQIVRIDGQWRLDHKLPFNDSVVTDIAPVAGQHVVGSGTGPLELSGTVVNLRSASGTFILGGSEYRIGVNGLEKNTATATDDTPVWTPLNPPVVTPDFPVTSVNGQTGDVTVTKSSVGLSNVDNTADVNKPVSTAVATVLDNKADLSGGKLAPTQIPPLAPADITGLPTQLTQLSSGNAANAATFQSFLDSITGKPSGTGTTSDFLTRLSGLFTATSWQNFLDILSGKTGGAGTISDVSTRLSALDYTTGTFDASKLSNLSATPGGIPPTSINGLLTSLGNLLSVSYWQNALDQWTGKSSGTATTTDLNNRLSALDYNTGAPDASKLTNVANIPAIASEKITGLNASLNSLLPISIYQNLVDAIANALGHSGSNHTWADIETYLGIIPPTNVTNVLGGANLGADLTLVNSTATTAQTNANTANTQAARKAQNDTILADWLHQTYPLGSATDTAATLVGGKRTWWGAWNDNLTLLGQMLGITPPTTPASDIGTAVTTAQTTANNASTAAGTAQTAAGTAQTTATTANTNAARKAQNDAILGDWLHATYPLGSSSDTASTLIGGKRTWWGAWNDNLLLLGQMLGIATPTTPASDVAAAVTTAQTTANNANTAAGTAQTAANTAQTAAGTAQTTANTAQTRAARKAQNDLILGDWLHTTYPLGSASDTAATLVGGKRTWWGAWNDNLVLLGQMLGITAPTDPASDVGAAITTAQSAANTAQTTASGAQTAASTAQTNLSSTLTALTGSSSVPTSSTPITSPISAPTQLPSGIPATKIANVLGGSNLGADVSAVSTSASNASTAAGTAQTTANTNATRVARKAQNDLIINDWLHVTYPLGAATDTATTLVGGKRTWWGAWNDNLALLGAMLGISTPTDPASDVGGVLSTHATNITTAQSAANAAQSTLNTTNTNLFGSTTPGIAVLPAALPNIAAGTGAGQSSDLLTHLNAVATAAGTSGATPSGAAVNGMNLITNTLSGLSSKVQNQLTQSGGAAQSGVSLQVTFANYPDGPFSAAPFNTTYSGSGTGGLVISGGDAVWNAVSNGDRSVVGIFNGSGFTSTVTLTDYQELQATLSGYPNGGNSKNYALLRANPAGTTYVYGLVYLNTSFQLCWEIGCVVAGTPHVFRTGVNAPLNLNFTFVAGVSGNPYRFQGISGDKVVFDYTDAAHVSQLGANFRSWGFRSDTANGGQTYPAPAAYVGCSDNAPVATIGSGVRVYHSPSTVTSMGTTFNIMLNYPPNWFDSTFYSTPGYSFASSAQLISNGQSPYVQVTNAGWYDIEMLTLINSATVGTGAVMVHGIIKRWSAVPGSVGGADETKLMPSGALLVNGFGGQYSSSHVGGNCGIFCNAGDYIQIGLYLDTNSSGTLSAWSITGDALGTHSYWGIKLANWSLN
jgi:hypothetical protein